MSGTLPFSKKTHTHVYVKPHLTFILVWVFLFIFSNHFFDYLLVKIHELLLIMGIAYLLPKRPRNRPTPKMTTNSEEGNNFDKHKEVNYNFVLMGD